MAAEAAQAQAKDTTEATETKSKTITIKLDDDLYQRIRREAYERDVSKGEVARAILTDAMRKQT